jgi:hypothetical protein
MSICRGWRRYAHKQICFAGIMSAAFGRPQFPRIVPSVLSSPTKKAAWLRAKRIRCMTIHAANCPPTNAPAETVGQHHGEIALKIVAIPRQSARLGTHRVSQMR